jgi:aldehyde dehydrogenase (NAD+)
MRTADIVESLEYGPAPESAQIAREWLERHDRRFDLFVGGAWRAPEGDRRFPTFHPGDAGELALVAQAGPSDVDAAVAAARAALPVWQSLGHHERAKRIYALARLIQKHARLFSVLESLDNGKPIRETRDLDIPLAARHFYYHAGWAQLIESEFPGRGPVGVCGQIIPWNFPLLMLAWKVAPSLACGNAVVLKPAEFTPLTALLFAEICSEANLPPGVVNILTGDGESGRHIVEHPGVDKIAFTGSTEVGRIIRRATAGSPKRLSLELGGKSPFIVFDDADLDSAVEGLVDAIWFNQGQVCCAGSRLLVQEGVADRLYAKLRARMANLRTGDPLDKAVDLGAIIDPVQLERIDALVRQGVEEGAELYQPEAACPTRGWFYPPTLLTGVAPAATVAQVEIFGPVLVAMTFRTPDEAVALANNTVYGLAASVWTENLSLAHDVAARVHAGTVWVNCTNLFDAAAGFGGYRESGFGREGGREGLLEYLAPPRGATEPYPLGDQPAPRPLVDRTHKQFIAGKQTRPDSGYSLAVPLVGGGVEEVARGNRKDVRAAVEAARAAQPAWAALAPHARAQVLFYLAENLAADRVPVAESIQATTGRANAGDEVDRAVEALFACAAWADKFDGQTHGALARGLVYTRHEPVGVVAILCPDEWPLLAHAALAGAAIAMGCAVIVVASEPHPLASVELYRLLDASDMPGGVWNILTGLRAEVALPLAEHDGVEALWAFAGDPAELERATAGNLKRTWRAPYSPDLLAESLRQAVQVKNVWVPYGA